MKKSLLLILGLIVTFYCKAQLSVFADYTPEQYVQSVLKGNAVTISNVVYYGSINSTAKQIGRFTTGSTATNLGMNSGIILSSGTVTAIPGAATTQLSTNTSSGSDADLDQLSALSTYDKSSLEFDVVPAYDSLMLSFVFASEEYPEYVCSSYNDVFGFFLSGPGISGSFTNNAMNIALIPGTNIPISINSVNPGVPGSSGSAGGCVSLQYSNLYVNNSAGTSIKFDGFTKVVTLKRLVQPGMTYHVKIAVGDAGDSSFDSAIFLLAGSLNSVPSNYNFTCPQSLGTGLVSITSLPFSSGSQTTCGALNDITGAMISSATNYTFLNGEDKVYTFIPPVSGSVTIDLNSAGINTGLFVFRECPFLNHLVSERTGLSGNKSTCIAVDAGVTYYIIVDSKPAPACNDYSLTVSYPMPPAENDEPCSAVLLTAGPQCSFQSFSNECSSSSLMPSAPSCGNYSGGDVWFKAIVPQSGNLMIDTKDLEISNAGMALYTGSCYSLTQIACDDNNSINGLMPEITKTGLAPLSTVYIRVWENGNDTAGTFGICVSEPIPSVQDCGGAIALTQNVFIQNNSFSGSGNFPAEINGSNSCLLAGEINSVWYKFTTVDSGYINFTINPLIQTDDYDWAVFDITNSNCQSIFTDSTLEVACNYSANSGPTGPNGNVGSQFTPQIATEAGRNYVVVISNFSATQGGYSIDFSNSTAVGYQIAIDTVHVPQFNSQTVDFVFSTPVLCSSVSAGDFILAGPDGIHNVTNVDYGDCDTSGMSVSFSLTISPPLTIAGFYTLSAPDSIAVILLAQGDTALVDDFTFAFSGIEISTATPTNISSTSASTGGTIIGNGGYPVYARGVCWSVNTAPSISNSFTSNGSGNGSFQSYLNSLLPGTTYYVRAYATNAYGTAYGNEYSFTTLCGYPSISIDSIYNVTATKAISRARIVNSGGCSIIQKGICWGTLINPTVSNNLVIEPYDTTQFVSLMPNLMPSTMYYARAFVNNGTGIIYSSNINFTTADTVIVISTNSVSNIAGGSGTSGGSFIYTGGINVIQKGVCWSTQHNPTVADSHTENGSGAVAYTSNMAGLMGATVYYVRAYAQAGQGVFYGNEVYFTTGNTIPTVTTSNLSAVNTTTASGGGTVVSSGGLSVTERGVCWSLNTNPVVPGLRTINGTGTGSFNSNIAGLQPGTTYHLRAYAKNALGIAYGNEIVFTTQAVAPTVSTTNVTNITGSMAACGGNVLSEGGANVIARGVCWSPNPSPVVTDFHTTDGSGSGVFSSIVTGLSPLTTYFVRAYATNSVGTSYGAEFSFTTTELSGYRIIGMVQYNNTTFTPMANIGLKLMQGSSVVSQSQTNSTGDFEFQEVAAGSYVMNSIIQYPWGGVTATDALKLKRHLAGIEIISEPIRLSAADVNNSLSLSSTDALKIQRRIAGLDSAFARPDWLLEKKTEGGNNLTVTGNTSQNFYALCAGDINGSNIPGIFARRTTESFSMWNTLNVEKDKLFVVPLYFTGAEKIGAFQLEVKFNETLAGFVSANVKNDAASLVYNEENGVVKLNWASLDYIVNSDNSAIVNLVFTGKRIGDFEVQSTGYFEVADNDGNILENSGVESVSINIQETGIVSSEMELHGFDLYPNPAKDEMIFTCKNISMPEKEISIINLLGQKVDLRLQKVQDGKYIIDVSALNNGAYFIEVSTSGIKYVRKFMIYR